MGIDVTVTIGGEAGQGIQTVGDLLTRVCHSAGLYLMAVNDFESRIRGGHSFMQMRISDQPVFAPFHRIHLLIALNRETLELHQAEMVENGVVLWDGPDAAEASAGGADEATNILAVPFSEMAKEAGGKILANTVAAGACLALLGTPFSSFETVLRSKFGKKEKILENNINAGRSGFDSVRDADFKWKIDWPSAGPKGKLLSGSKALALGAVAADCRLAAFYPMSPATGIMVELAEFMEMERMPVVVEQTEDEISAVNMIIGASYAGVRAMTATSGGGFALMAEGLGLAGITETPIVIINSQRPGPATGLPTRTGQADLLFIIHAAQDEFPRFVFAPTSADSGYDTVIRAFDLAEKYQVPVIILTDQYFNDSLWITTRDMKVPEKIERYLATDDDLKAPAEYKRFALTESGISPRALPCKGKALVCVTANEHSEDGHMSERIADRNAMVEKRQRKQRGMTEEMEAPVGYHGESSSLLVGWGSVDGVIREAVDLLRAENFEVGALIFRDLWPFPAKKAADALAGCKQFICVEQNASAQLGLLIRQQTGRSFDHAILKYDGRPFTPNRIAEQFKAILEGE